MFTGTIKELLEAKIANVMKYSQILIDDEYESSNIASQKELKAFVVISLLITLRSYNHLLTTQ